MKITTQNNRFTALWALWLLVTDRLSMKKIYRNRYYVSINYVAINVDVLPCFESLLADHHCMQLCRISITPFISNLLRVSSTNSTSAGTSAITRKQWEWEKCTIAIDQWCNVLSVVICWHWSDTNHKRSSQVCNSVVCMYPSGRGPAYPGPICWGLYIAGPLH